MRPTPFRPLALVAVAVLVLSGCASKNDPTADTLTTATGLGQFGDPNAAGAGAASDVGVGTGGGLGFEVAPVGSDGLVTDGGVYGSTGVIDGSTGAIDGSTLGGLGQAETGTYTNQGAYGVDNGLVDGGIISAAPQYTDGTVYTDTTVYDDSTVQPYDNTLFDNSAVDPNASQYTTYSNQGGSSLNGYSFPGDNGQPTYFNTQVGNRVLFDTDSVILTDNARETLRRQVAWLQLHPEHGNVILEGHADERGTREYNLALGARRADAVRAYMSSLGVPASRLRTVSFGKERPLSLGSNPQDWAKNRRVETVIGNGASF